MNWEKFLTILISTGVIAAAVAAIANVIVTIMNNHRLKSLENNKRMSELIQFRYLKLYSILEELESKHGFTVYANNPDKTLQESLNKRLEFVALYKLSRVLLSKNICISLDKIANEEDIEFKKISKSILDNNIKEFNKNADLWCMRANMFLEELSKAIQEQIINLIKV